MSFLTEIESFLLDLQSKYGFLIPVDRMRESLVCAQNVTDLEEVYYRLQSMVCRSQEQTESFHSLFGQRFLNLKPPPAPGSQTKKAHKNAANPEALVANMERTITSLSNEIERRAVALEAISRDRDSKLENLRWAQEKVDRERAAARAAQEAREAAIKNAALSPDDPVVKKALQEMMSALEKYQESCAGQGNRKQHLDVDALEKELRNSISAEDGKSILKEQEANLMKKASTARSSGQLDSFKALLDLIAALKSFQKGLSETANSEAGKQLQLANKNNRMQSKKLSDAETQAANAKADFQAVERRMQAAMRLQNAEQAKLRAHQQETKELLERIYSQTQPKEIVKEKAVVHRDIFLDGVNAVRTTNEEAKLLQTNIKQMSAQERQEILAFIRANARIFRQTLRRSSATHRRRRVDVKATTRAASRTNGEPMVVKYKQPRKSHAKVVCLVDISGSCKNASTLALYFMAMMDDAFPGGCKKFAFVNSLEPVDTLFRDKSADEGVQSVFETIPTRGVYSDYGTTIQSLKDDYAGLFHKDTTLIILGDARNNNRATHAEELKYLADRSHRVFWLNTDEPGKWNQGDSIIGTYEQAGAKVHHVATVGDLLGFLSTVSLASPTAI